MLNASELKQHMGAFRFYGLLLLAVLLSVYLGFTLGDSMTEKERREIETLRQTLDNVHQDNHRLTRQLNILGVELDVQRIAAQKAHQQLQSLMEQENQLRQQLSFYQKIMAPELTQDGFVIDAFDVSKTLSDNTYRFDLVLLQQDKIKNTVKGNLKVTLRGSQDGKSVELSLLSLMPEGTPPLTFSFKYFQVIDGQFALPEGFLPEQIVVHSEIYQFKRKRGELEQVFPWVTI